MNESKINNFIIAEKFHYALALENYSPKRVLFWKNCAAHLRRAFHPALSKKERVVHFFIGLIQLPPLIGQIAALFEAAIIKCFHSHSKKSTLHEMKRVGLQENFNTRNEKGLAPLHVAVENGNLEGLRLLIKAGADLNILDKDGYAAVHRAVLKGNLKALDMLIKAGADLNILCKDGYTAVHMAVLGKSLETLDMLIEAGADLNIPIQNGYTAVYMAVLVGNLKALRMLMDAGADTDLEIFKLKNENHYCNLLSLLKKSRPENYQEFFDLLSVKHPNLLKKYKEYSLIKAIGHATNLEGMIDLEPISGEEKKLSVDLEGGESKFWMHKMYKSTTLMKEKHPNLLSNSDSLCSMLEFSSNQSKDKIDEILKRIQRKEAVMLSAGFPGHAICVLMQGEHIIICNRGDLSNGAPIQVFRYDQSLLTEEFIEALLKATYDSPEEFLRILSYMWNKRLNFKQESLEKGIQNSCTLPMQQVGNCSWASPEAAVWAFLFLQRVKELQSPNQELDMEQIKEEIDKQFYSWVVFNQLYHLERYMNIYQLRKPPTKEKESYKQRDMYKIDKKVICKAFVKNFQIKKEQIEPSIAEERQEIRKKFNQIEKSF